MTRRLRYAMVGGGRDAFIGAVHRAAMALDGQYEMVAGALSSTPQRSRESGRDIGLADDRNHGTWQELLADETSRPGDQRADIVVLVTPNHLHYEPARAFVDAGFHVVCDKPLVHTTAQAEDLAALVAARGTLFAVTYNYTGYPMVREARELVSAGAIGAVRKVVVEYHQGWLAGALESSDNKQSEWRKDPARGGPAGAMADIGSHAENLVATVTGLEMESLCADLTAFGAGRRLDDDAGLLLRFVGGARGVMSASQIAAGHENDLRLRVIGERGLLDWRQEEPNLLIHAPVDGPRRTLTRNSPGLSEAARRACRLPPGHPEGFIEAFANLYQGVATDLRMREAHGRAATTQEAEYPRIGDGVRGVRFIEKTVASSASHQKWTLLR
ncbi:Gfo/Idh/MocA family protein [Scleromatobacter humisilvae]|uniref:Gfo/Idh/MocA family oxidoreductase n=1 Tax=Scleromatobacter humisilvae TaxID=2897159 RepID=A0A9X1YLY1_9BURK|nr:Gfo/Idh/MocA family oxidoreductase [Scleromatobacter humisilvae]MCK9688583.1 Gfo/Idh/MocA family oxidoreductase [Scleromatobacter humisilvae]